MKPEKITNQTVMTTDFARTDRLKFLRSQPRLKRHKAINIAPGILANQVWMTDVSGMDRRSVKAQLAGKGGYRVAWWKLNCFVHALLKPRAALEQKMFAFHTRHHAVTLFWLEWALDYRKINAVVRTKGAIAGIRFARKQFDAERKHK